jgi:hypothetical protein
MGDQDGCWMNYIPFSIRFHFEMITRSETSSNVLDWKNTMEWRLGYKTGCWTLDNGCALRFVWGSCTLTVGFSFISLVDIESRGNKTLALDCNTDDAVKRKV